MARLRRLRDSETRTTQPLVIPISLVDQLTRSGQRAVRSPLAWGGLAADHNYVLVHRLRACNSIGDPVRDVIPRFFAARRSNQAIQHRYAAGNEWACRLDHPI